MTAAERNKYLEAYYDNESDANRHMGFATAFGGILLLAIWICYLTGLFFVSGQMKVLINITFPISTLILLSPLFFNFFHKELLKKPNYKYFVVFSFIAVIATLNILLPRNSLIAWALCIVVTNHYYNPKLCKFTFIISLVLMLLCLYLSLFVGEFDSNILGGKVIEDDNSVKEVFGFKERYEFYMNNFLMAKTVI